MDSSSGISSGSGLSGLQNSGSEEELRQLMDERKRKRMISNRESAKRSRMRKQKHLENLTAEVTRFRKENSQMVTAVSAISRRYSSIEAENLVLMAQASELSHRLTSLNDIIGLLSVSCGVDTTGSGGEIVGGGMGGGGGNTPWNYSLPNQTIRMAASVNMFQY